MSMNKWFVSAAVSGSGFEEIADKVVDETLITSELLKDIDLLFVKDKETFMPEHRGLFFTIVTDRHIDRKDQEKFILEHPGNFFISRLGHDIINLISPLEHYEYIEHDLITKRVASGNHFGKQINFIGHIIQGTAKTSGSSLSPSELLENIRSLCRKLKVEVEIVEKAPLSGNLNRTLLTNVIEETILNLKEHSNGNNRLTVSQDKLIFCNDLKKPLNLKRPKAQLRCPFMQKNTGKGHGLGLYMLSIASSKGDFDWNIQTDENCFTLSLSFS